jgi:type IV secretion system protein VirD4
MLDEFPRLGKIDIITSAISTLRSKGITIAIFCQSLSQLDAIYGKPARQTIIDNCQYKAILNATDVESQDYFSKLIGIMARSTRSYGESHDSEAENLSYSSQISLVLNQPILYPHEFATLKDIVLITPKGFCRVDRVP